jgi:hypothetical protein
MSAHPRFQAEYSIRQSLEELRCYASVFHGRIAPAFETLEDDARRIQEDEYSRLVSLCPNPEYADPAYGAEEAYFKGVDFYVATNAIRQGLVNLMVAGLCRVTRWKSAWSLRFCFAPSSGATQRIMERRCVALSRA